MKRRDFSLLCGAGLVATVGLESSALAQSKPPLAGSDYVTLNKPAPVEAAKPKIEVVEFFWYNCPHCNAFEPSFDAWRKTVAKDVAVRRVPVAFRDDFAPQQRLFYALETLGLLDKLHARVFTAIHTEKQNLSSADAITDWVVKQGVNKAQFLAQFNSFSTATKINQAKQLQNAYQIEGVPALGVAGRFWTDGEHAKSMQRVLQVVDYLVAQVRAGR